MKIADDRLSVMFFAKADGIRCDADAARAVGAKSVAGLWQMHGKDTVIIREPSDRTVQADGMITDVPGLALCIRAADCQNFVVYAPAHHVAGVLHVGWRGLIAGAIPEFFRVLKKEWGIDPSQTFVGAGPSLCKRCAEFTNPARELPSLSPQFVEKRHVDLQGAADAEFIALGVPENAIERSPDCTCCHPEKYWTYRGGDREAVKNGQTNMLVCLLK